MPYAVLLPARPIGIDVLEEVDVKFVGDLVTCM
jgi:hypothetical protein